ncbi:tail fiber protein [Paenibacillus phoenicis]|uniref:tail fiber protein n=1 Tax=Paenibacillus phoenicis TaxID=554117 RepID=UPI003D2E7A1C
MSSWSYALTNKGRQLQAKAQAGAQLVYTMMAVGSGTLSGQSLESMTALITPIKDLNITRLKRPAGASRALIGATLTNQDVTTGFYLREVGIFADDPDDGEILYMYANSGATADYITPQGDGVIEKALNMNVFVGAAANVTANIDESLVYVTQEELADAIAGIQINDATTTQKGIVQLSNDTNSTAEDRAATPKAVKSAYDTAMAAQTTANAANEAAATAQSNIDIHAALTTAHGATSAATANRLIARDSAGRAKVAAPSASDDIARKDTVDNAVGNLSNLLTSAKGNAVAAINELFTSASNGKSQIAAAITGKGVPASGSDTFVQLAEKIGQILAKQRGTSTINFGENTSPITSTNRIIKEILTLPKATSYFRFVDTGSSYIRSGYNSDNSAYGVPTVSLMDANNILYDLFYISSGATRVIGEFYIIFAESTIVSSNGLGEVTDLSSAQGPFKIVYTYRQNKSTSNYPWSYILMRGNLSYE